MVYTNAKKTLVPVKRNGKPQIMLGTIHDSKKVFSLLLTDDMIGLLPNCHNYEYQIKPMQRGPHKLIWNIGSEFANDVYLLLFAESKGETAGEIQVLEEDLHKVETLVASRKTDQEVRLLKCSKNMQFFIRVKHYDETELFYVNTGEVEKVPVYGIETLLDKIQQWHSV